MNSPTQEENTGTRPGIKIWIDLGNTPHVPFFIPIIRELGLRGLSIALTARDAFRACALAEIKVFDTPGLDAIMVSQ
jgi:hypothetical protein